MSKWPVSWRVILLFVFCCVLSGCVPIAESTGDEEKDPNFIEGRNHLNMMDYKGAVESFERAVQSNPRNAAAHFELAVLYQDRIRDPLAAAFHYEKHLQLRPKSEYLVAAKEGLIRCKMDIARTVTFAVIGEDIHKELRRLTNDLAVAKKQNEVLAAQIATKPTVVTQWMKFTVTNYFTNYARLSAAAPTTVTQAAPRTVVTNPPPRLTPLPATPTNYISRPMQQRAAANTQQPAPRVRTHLVRAGDTMSNVARRYGVSLPKLQAANPTVDSRRLRAGQTLNIPSQ
ncbi:MAG TPA: LysM peptidoglycan-binding domain-containing protein [Verrucomicrobiae bacterium]|nr:LysM peptidoglycan-binding domain-containing protein [Verrucomicrobiae bacterium]